MVEKNNTKCTTMHRIREALTNGFEDEREYIELMDDLFNLIYHCEVLENKNEELNARVKDLELISDKFYYLKRAVIASEAKDSSIAFYISNEYSNLSGYSAGEVLFDDRCINDDDIPF